MRRSQPSSLTHQADTLALAHTRQDAALQARRGRSSTRREDRQSTTCSLNVIPTSRHLRGIVVDSSNSTPERHTLWQIQRGRSTSDFRFEGCQGCHYHLHLVKRDVILARWQRCPLEVLLLSLFAFSSHCPSPLESTVSTSSVFLACGLHSSGVASSRKGHKYISVPMLPCARVHEPNKSATNTFGTFSAPY